MLHTSTNYDYSGRKRKKKSVKGETFKKRPTEEFRELRTAQYTHRSSGVHYPSKTEGGAMTPSRTPLVYSGERTLLGVGVMHKSNLVPVFGAEEARDLANMRRN